MRLGRAAHQGPPEMTFFSPFVGICHPPGHWKGYNNPGDYFLFMKCKSSPSLCVCVSYYSGDYRFGIIKYSLLFWSPTAKSFQIHKLRSEKKEKKLSTPRCGLYSGKVGPREERRQNTITVSLMGRKKKEAGIPMHCRIFESQASLPPLLPLGRHISLPSCHIQTSLFPHQQLLFTVSYYLHVTDFSCKFSSSPLLYVNLCWKCPPPPPTLNRFN